MFIAWEESHTVYASNYITNIKNSAILLSENRGLNSRISALNHSTIGLRHRVGKAGEAFNLILYLKLETEKKCAESPTGQWFPRVIDQ